MKQLFILILLILGEQLKSSSFDMFHDETIIYLNDTFYLEYSILNKLGKYDSIVEYIDSHQTKTCYGNRYIFKKIVWQIIDQQLYLINITGYDWCNHGSISVNLNEIFKCTNGKVEANWINQNVIAGKGVLLIDELYTTDGNFSFKNGRLDSYYETNNSVVKSIYALNRDSLNNFLYKNIDWNKIPKRIISKGIKVYVSFEGKENGITNVSYLHQADITLPGSKSKTQSKKLPKKSINEIVRVVKELPGWNLYYRNNILLTNDNRVALEIIINRANKKRYTR